MTPTRGTTTMGKQPSGNQAERESSRPFAGSLSWLMSSVLQIALLPSHLYIHSRCPHSHSPLSVPSNPVQLRTLHPPCTTISLSYHSILVFLTSLRRASTRQKRTWACTSLSSLFSPFFFAWAFFHLKHIRSSVDCVMCLHPKSVHPLSFSYRYLLSSSSSFVVGSSPLVWKHMKTSTVSQNCCLEQIELG